MSIENTVNLESHEDLLDDTLVSINTEVKQEGSVVPYVLATLLTILVVLTSFATAISISYSEDEKTFEVSRYISIEEGVSILLERI